MRPATRIGRTVLYPGGAIRVLTRREWLMLKLRRRKTVKTYSHYEIFK